MQNAEQQAFELNGRLDGFHGRFDEVEKMLANIEASASGGSGTLVKGEFHISALRMDNDNLLGRGTHGVVIGGHLVHGDDTVPVAVKKVDLQDQQAAKSVMKEIGALTKLRHAHIVRLLGACQEVGPGKASMLVVLELCPLGGLDRVLGIFKGDETTERVQEWATRCLGTTGGNPMGLEGVSVVREARSRLSMRLDGPLGAGANKAFFLFFSRVMDAIQYIHSQSQVHRDVKPENVLLDARGRPKISDFGLTIAFGTMAVPTHGDGGGGGGGAGVGTPGYMPPEVVKNGQHSTKGDIFSLAILMTEVLTGTRAFSDKHGNPYTINIAVADGERPLLPSDIPPALHKLLSKMWHESPQKRPTARAVAAALDVAHVEFEEGEEEEGDGSGAAQRRRQSIVGRNAIEVFPQELVDMLTPIGLTEAAMAAVLHHLCNEWGATRVQDLEELGDGELEEVAKLVPLLKKRGLKQLLKQAPQQEQPSPNSGGSGGLALPTPPPALKPSPPVAPSPASPPSLGDIETQSPPEQLQAALDRGDFEMCERLQPFADAFEAKKAELESAALAKDWKRCSKLKTELSAFPKSLVEFEAAIAEAAAAEAAEAEANAQKAEAERRAREKAAAAAKQAAEEKAAAAKQADAERLAREKAMEAAAMKAAEEKAAVAKQAEAERLARENIQKAATAAAAEKTAEEKAAAAKQAEAERLARERAHAAKRAAEEKPSPVPLSETERAAAIKRVVGASPYFSSPFGGGRLNWSAKKDMSTWSRVKVGEHGLLEVDLDKDNCGFVFSAGGSLLQDIALIFGHRLGKLNLYRQENVNGDISVFANNPNLTHLYLYNTKVQGDISVFANNPNLTQLYLINTKVQGDISVFANNPNLTVLRLYNTQVQGDISVFANNPKLRWLDLNNTKVQGDISVFANNPNLTELRLWNTKVQGDEAALKKALPHCNMYTDL